MGRSGRSGGSGRSGRRPRLPLRITIREGNQEYLEDLGNGIVITPSGPVEPWDCERWPGSPYCGGGFNPWGILPIITNIEISISNCEILLVVHWAVAGFAQPTFTIGYRLPNCNEEEDEIIPDPEDEEDPAPPLPLPLGDLISHAGCVYCIVFYRNYPYFTTNNSLEYNYEGRLIYGEFNTILKNFEGNTPFNGFIWEDLICEFLEFGGFPIQYYGRDGFGEVVYDNARAYNNSFGTSPEECISKARDIFNEAKLNSIMGKPPWYSFEVNDGKIYLQNPQQPLLLNPWGIPGFESSQYYIYPHPAFELDGAYQEYPVAIAALNCKINKKTNNAWPLPMKKDCCDKELNQIIIRKLNRIESVIQPDKFHTFDEKGESTKIIGKAPNSMIFPQAKGYMEIAGISDLATFFLKYLDRVFGVLPVSANIVDADPNTPGDQGAVLQFHSFSEALGAIIEANGGEISLLYKLGNLINNSEKGIHLLQKLATSTLLEAGINHQISVVIQKAVESIQDYLDFKIRQSSATVPFAFNPNLDPLPDGAEDKVIEKWVDDFTKPSDVSVTVTDLDYNGNSKLFSDIIREIASNAQAAAASAKRDISSEEDLKKLVAEEKSKLDIESALMIQLIRKALGLPASIDLDGFSAALTDSFEDNPNLDVGLIQNYPEDKPQIKRATKDGKKI